jgi:pimeloyl-ACP methyl ester carboxylesterase
MIPCKLRLMSTLAAILTVAMMCGESTAWAETAAGGAETPAVSQVGSVPSDDGVPIAYETFGRGDPALVFVHGWCCDRGYWREQVGHFFPKYQVVTIDLGGHGASGRGRTNWTVEAFAEDVKAVVEKLDLSRCILIGHSMGGAVIVEAARRMPGRIIGLIGVDTFSNVELVLDETQIQAFMKPLRENFAKGTRDFIAAYMFTEQTDTTLSRRIVDDMASAPSTVGLSAMENLLRYNLMVALKDMRLPIQCVNSSLFPLNYDGGRRHAASFEVNFMDGVGHFPMLEKPQEFNQKLENAIQKLVAKSGKATGPTGTAGQ